jgi:hypothetical protein
MEFYDPNKVSLWFERVFPIFLIDTTYSITIFTL